jgi:hypothetical protein
VIIRTVLFDSRAQRWIMESYHSMERAIALSLTMAVSLILAGCGTNVHWLVERDSAVLPQAAAVVSDAEQSSPELSEPVYAAEDNKIAACKFMNDAVVDRLQRDPGFGEQFVSDLGVVVALLVPIAKVERCADALDSYVATVNELEQRLNEVGSTDSPAEQESGG